MEIELLCNDGSPIGVTPYDIPRRGVGGAELTMLTLVEVLAARGHRVRVYNDPQPCAMTVAGVDFLPRSAWIAAQGRDVIIIFRSPCRWANWRGAARLRHIWWSLDQYTVGDFRSLASAVDVGVCISPYHRAYHMQVYGLPPSSLVVIEPGIRTWEYDRDRATTPKVKNRLIYCSMPERGLEHLLQLWPALTRSVPDISLVITADYRLWGAPSAMDTVHRVGWGFHQNVLYLGAVPRRQLVQEQLKAEIQAYPCIYEELFCISTAECAVAGALPVTSAKGALATTNADGIIIPGAAGAPEYDEAFVSRIVSLLTDDRPYLERRQREVAAAAAQRWDWLRIARQWERLMETGSLEADK